MPSVDALEAPQRQRDAPPEPHGPDGMQQCPRLEEHEAARARLDVVDAQSGVAVEIRGLRTDVRAEFAAARARGRSVEVQEQRHFAVILAGGAGRRRVVAVGDVPRF